MENLHPSFPSSQTALCHRGECPGASDRVHPSWVWQQRRSSGEYQRDELLSPLPRVCWGGDTSLSGPP